MVFMFLRIIQKSTTTECNGRLEVMKIEQRYSNCAVEFVFFNLLLCYTSFLLVYLILAVCVHCLLVLAILSG